ncbi:hypothetical protein [Cardiobacterium valvarum]|uniref:Uncharacterized protein n=1 Tax=Cardiobacterium valvarum F0432 TaxID=797473 RepID=G9ZFS3_9GAMM|nr:hypothetical protein [Cardiobacterium valvarum]EHM53765.1 hypothetical protein HMPREF9080_01575 [Cardiobacterium valvarum F0432]
MTNQPTNTTRKVLLFVLNFVFTDGEAITVRQKNVDVTRGEGGIIDL